MTTYIPIPTTHKRIAHWYLLAAVGWFIVAILIGWVLRYSMAGNVYEGFVFKYWLHAHSHIAFLGWIFNALIGLTLWTFPMKENAAWHKWLFGLAQFSVAAMLFTFPQKGYYLWSIIFSTLHIFVSYFIAFRFIKDSHHQDNPLIKHAIGWMKWALFFMVISSIGPYLLGVIMARGMEHTIWYKLAIYFYLHFQYNAWFLAQAIALIMVWIARYADLSIEKINPRALYLFVGGVVLTYAQSAIWTDPALWVRWAGWLGAILQLAALFYLWKDWWPIFQKIKINRFARKLLTIAVFAILLKSLLQLAMMIPELEALSYNHQVVIAFLHLIFLGGLTPFLFGQTLASGMLASLSQLQQQAFAIFLVAFFLMEIFLVIPAMFYWWPVQLAWNDAMLWITTLMTGGMLAFLFLTQRKLLKLVY